jgi:hypothetical protein
MKKITFLILAALLTSTMANAKIWRVNNTPDGNGDFTTLLAAHDAGSNGDTILVEPSQTVYAGINMVKRFVILGSGYFLDENFGKQDNPVNTKITYLNFNNKGDSFGEFESSSSGSVVSGVEIHDYVQIFVGNITVRRCKVYGSINISPMSAFGNFSISGFLISQNFLYGNIQTNYTYVNLTVTNLLVQNNIFAKTTSDSPISFGDGVEAVIENNVFRTTVATTSLTFKNSVFRNNIITAGTTITLTVNSSTVEKNVANHAFTITGTGNTFLNNINNATATSIYEVDPFAVNPTTGFTSDTRWRLKSGSPAIGAGYDGVDCGAFGGTSPYVIAGIPAIPAIYELRTNSVGVESINIKAKVRSNN